MRAMRAALAVGAMAAGALAVTVPTAGAATAEAKAGPAAAVAPAATAAPAGAYGCAGNQVDTYSVKTTGGTVYGTIHLYYDSSTGLNCAVSVANSAGGYGTKTEKTIDLFLCDPGTKAGQICPVYETSSDGGNYAYYAGPVTMHAAGQCIALDSNIRSPSGTWAYVQTDAVHCG